MSRRRSEPPRRWLPSAALLALWLALASLGRAGEPLPEPGSFQGRLLPDTTTGELRLPNRYIDPATLLVLSPEGDTLRAGSAFDLDPTAGRLTFLQGVAAGSLFVRYRYLPAALVDTLQLHRPLRAGVVDSLLRGEKVELPVRAGERALSSLPGRNLRRSGHILRGVQVGSGRDVSLESGLRLALEGRLARDIEVKALLDDRSVPLTPEGSSQRLSEIDQVYIDLRAGRSRGRFGDYMLAQEAGRYGTFERHLEGGRVEYAAPDGGAGLAGAVTRAVFHTNRFLGATGVQGPYRLTGRDGERDLLVIGGSEKVWVDGVLRRRGETADYTIDYNRGEITFTPGLPITSESRIEVDFEYSPEAFPRNFYQGHLAASDPGGRFKLQAVALQEGDDPERPFAFDFTPGMRQALASAGDGPGRAAVPAADSLGPGRGDYTREDTTLADGTNLNFFRFVPPAADGSPRGEWRVYFSEMGPGRGDYERRFDASVGSYVFEWAGPSLGAWSPVRLVPLPERLRLGAVQLRLDPDARLSLAADIGVSGYDGNTLSPAGDEDNLGLAQSYAARFKLPSEGRLPLLEAGLTLREEGARWHPFSRTREVEYDRRWGLDTARAGVRERERGASLVLRPLEPLRLTFGASHLERGGTVGSGREEAGFTWSGPGTQARGRLESISTREESAGRRSDWLRGRGSARSRIGLWIPSLEGEWERRDAREADTLFTGFTYLRARAGWGLAGWRGHSGAVSAEYRQRRRQVDAGRYDPLYDERAEGLLWAWNPPRSSWRSEVELSHRETRYSIADSSNITTDLASLRAGYAPLAGALTADLNYRLSRTVTRPNVLIAFQVPAGQGDYRRVGGQYVYDPEIGDIILRAEPSGEALPTTNLAAALNLDWSPRRLPGGAGVHEGFGWEDISLATTLEATEITRWDRPAEIYTLRLGSFQSDSTLEGRLAWRQDLHLFRSSRVFNLRLRYDTESQLSNLYSTGIQRNGRDTWNLRVRRALSESTDLESEATYTRSLKELAWRAGTDRFRLRRLSLSLSRRLSRSLRFTGQVRGLLDRKLGQGDDVRGLGLKPGIVWARSDRGRISADFEALWIETKSEVLPFELADGRPEGRNGRGNLRADYRIGGNLTARAVYTLRLDANRAAVHIARVEVSAFF